MPNFTMTAIHAFQNLTEPIFTISNILRSCIGVLPLGVRFYAGQIRLCKNVRMFYSKVPKVSNREVSLVNKLTTDQGPFCVDLIWSVTFLFTFFLTVIGFVHITRPE